MQNTHNVQENNEFIYVHDACNSLFAKRKTNLKKEPTEE
jgi:hypothetical protein